MPPTPTKQIPPRSQAVVPKGNGILSRAIPVSQLVTPYIKMVIYGKNRVGKTHLACQFPKPLLLVSFEPAIGGGAGTVANVEGVTLLQLTSSKDAVTLAEELRQKNPFETVVLDSATSFQDRILAELMNLPAIPEQMDWGMVSSDQYRQRSEKTKSCLKPFLSLQCHTVVTAKERDHNPPKEVKVNPKTGKVQPDMRAGFLRGHNDTSYVAADLGGGAVEWLNDACDNIAQLIVDEEVIEREERTSFQGKENIRVIEERTGKRIRRLRVQHHPNFAAGIRSATPEKVPEFIDNPTYDKILAVIKGE